MGWDSYAHKWLSQPQSNSQIDALIEGLIPLPPRDRIFILFFLINIGHERSEDILRKLNQLDSKEVSFCLADPECPDELIDFFMRLFVKDDGIIQRVVSHRNLHGESVLWLLGLELSSDLLTRIAERDALIRSDSRIVDALSKHANTPQWIRDKFNYGKTPAESLTPVEEVEEILVTDPETLNDKEVETINNRITNLRKELPTLTVGQKIALAMKGNKEVRTLLIRDPNKVIQKAVLENPRITDEEILLLCHDKMTPIELLREISMNKQWTKNYGVKLNLVKNPKTPLAIALGYLTSLRRPDLEQIAKSKNLPNAIVVQAESLLSSRRC